LWRKAFRGAITRKSLHSFHSRAPSIGHQEKRRDRLQRHRARRKTNGADFECAPRAAGESEKKSRSECVMPAMSGVEAEQYSVRTCDGDDSEVCRAAHEFSPLDDSPAAIDAC